MTLKVETGAITGQVDLVNKIYDFITTYSADTQWTAVDVRSFSSDRQCTIRMGTDCYFSFRSDVGNSRPRFYFRPHADYSAGASYTSQPGGPTDVNLNQKQNLSLPATTPFNYFFFADVGHFIFIFSIPGGWYQSGMCGKLGLYPGSENGIFTKGTIPQESALSNTQYDYNSTALTTVGDYMNGSFVGYAQIVGPMGVRSGSNSGALGAILSQGGIWRGFENMGLASPSAAVAHTGWAWNLNDTNGLTAGPCLERVWDVSEVNIVAPLIPGVVFIVHPTLAGKYFPFGRIPGVYYVCNRNIPSESVITVGGDRYQVFPGRTRDVVNRLRYCGVAVKTVAEA